MSRNPVKKSVKCFFAFFFFRVDILIIFKKKSQYALWVWRKELKKCEIWSLQYNILLNVIRISLCSVYRKLWIKISNKSNLLVWIRDINTWFQFGEKHLKLVFFLIVNNFKAKRMNVVKFSILNNSTAPNCVKFGLFYWQKFAFILIFRYCPKKSYKNLK